MQKRLGVAASSAGTGTRGPFVFAKEVVGFDVLLKKMYNELAIQCSLLTLP